MHYSASPDTPAPVLAVASPIRISTVFGTDAALIAEFDAFPDDELVCITWHGHLDSPAVVKVATEGLHLRQAGRSTPFVINDKSRATGEWADAMPWLEYEWLPQTITGGLRALAYVVSDDMHTYMAGFEFYARIRKVLPLQLFSSVADARQWLLEMKAGVPSEPESEQPNFHARLQSPPQLSVN